MKDRDWEKFLHDLKNPLTVMRMQLDLLQLELEKTPDSKIQKFLEVIDKEIERMKELLKG
jgi:signal transduction histidine kinase